jgi:hypothetical protein
MISTIHNPSLLYDVTIYFIVTRFRFILSALVRAVSPMRRCISVASRFMNSSLTRSESRRRSRQVSSSALLETLRGSIRLRAMNPSRPPRSGYEYYAPMLPIYPHRSSRRRCKREPPSATIRLRSWFAGTRESERAASRSMRYSWDT